MCGLLGSFWSQFTSCVYQLPSLFLYSLMISYVLTHSGGEQFYLPIPSVVNTDEYLTTAGISSATMYAMDRKKSWHSCVT